MPSVLRGLAALALLASLPAPAVALDVRIEPSSPRPGDVAMVFVAGAPGARRVEGSLGGRPLAFFPHGAEHAALGGIDLESNAGKVPWRVGLIDERGRPRERSGSVLLRAREFAVQRLTLPPGMVELDPETLRRVEVESARLRALYATLSPERLWRGRFSRPVGGDGDGTGFGARRVINGQPRMPHSGVDYAAPLGTPVVASNRGRVAMVGEFFFAGRLVVLDHGLGLYTLYFHLDRIDVPEGALVERGQPIGTVGATGRATGPHLHWGAQLHRARVDPTGLLGLGVSE